MGWIPDSFIDELLSRTSIEDVVGQYVPLERKGKRCWGRCPFHNEKTASFSVNIEEQFYYCFGCHASGTVFHFVQEMEHLDFPDAVRFLAERAHMIVPEDDSPRKGEQRVSSDTRERMYEANVAAARFYHATLWTTEGAQALTYLYKRGLNDGDIRRFGLGAAPRGDALRKHLLAQGFDDALLKGAGLTVERNGQIADMFRERVIFPIIDARGKVLGFGGRAMSDVKPKYLNTPDTPVFNKRKGLYAMNFANKERDAGHMVLVEGYMDTVSLRKYGVRGVVATLGTALTQEQAVLFRRQTSEVWISYDGDAAGQKAALRALDIFDEIDGLTAKVIDYPAGQDPDDFIRAQGLEGFNNLPKYDVTQYRLLRAKDGLDLDTQDGITQYAMRGCEILRRVKNPIVMENNLRALVQQTGYAREVLLAQIGNTPIAPPHSQKLFRPRSRLSGGTDELPREEQALLTLLSQGLIPAELVEADDFSREISRRVAKWLLEGGSVSTLLERIEDDETRAQAARALSFAPLPESRAECMEYARNCQTALRRARLNRRAEEIQEEIKTATPERKLELLRQMQQINAAIEEE